jgi:hypothetical protein
MTCVAPKITATEARTVEITTPNVGTPVPESRLNRSGNSPSLAAARGIWAQIMVQECSEAGDDDGDGHHIACPGAAQDRVGGVGERPLQRDRRAAADRGYGPPAADVERNVVCGLDGSTSSTEKTGLWPVLMKCSTYRTQPTVIAALPTHAVIQ